MIYSDFIKAESLKILWKTDFIWTFYSCKRCLKIHLGGCGEGSASEGSRCHTWWPESMSWDPHNRRRDSTPSVVSVLHTCALPTHTGQNCQFGKFGKTVLADMTWCVQCASRRQKSCTHLYTLQRESCLPVQKMNTNHKLSTSDAPLAWMPLTVSESFYWSRVIDYWFASMVIS